MGILFASVLTAVVGAQGVPDFSGKWVPIPGRTVPTELPHSTTLIISQTATTFTIATATKKMIYMLDGSPTKRQEKEGNSLHEIVATARWSNSKLTISEDDAGSKSDVTYQLDPADGSLVVTTSTTLLHMRGGALTVSTIGPFTRAYRKD